MSLVNLKMKAYILRNNIYITAITKCHNLFLSLSYLDLAASFILTSWEDLNT